MNKNFMVENKVYHYMMQPGDATCYRFSMEFYPEGVHPNEAEYAVHNAYVLDTGVGNGCGYVQVAINMPGGCGVGCIAKGSLDDFGKGHDYLIEYLVSHGFAHVDRYTLPAVLFAVQVLVNDPEAIDLAAENMLKAQAFLMAKKASK
jgi:hypothetical protein